MPRLKKRPLRAKYIIRRLMLAAVLIAILSGGGWLAYTRFLLPKLFSPVSAQVPATPALTSDSEPEPEPEPEPAPESAPEPRTTSASVNDWELLLANPSNYLPEDYKPELEAITDNYLVDKRIADSVKRMFADAKQDGINLVIISAYRSIEKQQTLFDQKEQEFIAQGKDEQEAVAAAAAIVAKPGSSEHQTGLALDIVTSSYTELDSGFADTPAFQWLDENSHKYGFVMRYPLDKQDITNIIYEPWHYRYVGEGNARIMKEKGFCLEEYINFLRQANNKDSESSFEEPVESSGGESESESSKETA